MNRPVWLLVAFVCASSAVLEAQHEIVLPKRRAVEQAPAFLPPLPPDSEQLKPMTMDVVVHGQPRKILRTINRILVTTRDREWLFERNSVDPRRVSATVIEHAEKAIVIYGESDVRNLLGFYGWAEVLALSAEGNSSPALVVERRRAGVDEQLLRPCLTRFPAYKVVEVADWLESK